MSLTLLILNNQITACNKRRLVRKAGHAGHLQDLDEAIGSAIDINSQEAICAIIGDLHKISQCIGQWIV